MLVKCRVLSNNKADGRLDDLSVQAKYVGYRVDEWFAKAKPSIHHPRAIRVLAVLVPAQTID
jgi:hypothetical protein